jgi:hypothetical protein
LSSLLWLTHLFLSLWSWFSGFCHAMHTTPWHLFLVVQVDRD